MVKEGTLRGLGEKDGRGLSCFGFLEILDSVHRLTDKQTEILIFVIRHSKNVWK